MTVTPSRIQRGDDPAVHLAAEVGQLGPVVGALGLHDVVDRVRADVQPGLAGELHGVGQVVLALGVVVAQPRQRLEQELGVEGEDPGVDLADLPLLGGGVLLLDDRLDVAVGVAHHPAVAERVGDDPGQDAHRPLGGLVLGRRTSAGSRPRAAGCRRTRRAPCPAAAPPSCGHGLHGHPDRVPGAVLLLLHRQHARPAPAPGCAGRPARAGARPPRRSGRGWTACTAASTWPIMLRPATGCSTFMVLDFIRVPPPAASTTTVSSLVTPITLPG